jgi:peptidyl-tRNA hydrolase, PTH1 family
MKIIVGLGNPGLNYRNTRHNFGFLVVQALAEQRGFRFHRARHRSSQAEGGLGKERVVLVRPLTFMNLSGVSVAGLAREHNCAPEDILVVCDDVNIVLGRLRLRRAGSAGGHNGLKSIIEHLRSDQFPRLRLGVGPPPQEADLMDFVLGPFRRSEAPQVQEMVVRAVQAVETWVYFGLTEAMNRFNN